MKHTPVHLLLLLALLLPSPLAAARVAEAAGAPAAYREAVRAQEAHRFNLNAVRAFVYNVFFRFDLHAPVDGFLADLADDGLEMIFPEASLRSHADFRAWYEGIGRTIRSNTHDVRSLAVRYVDRATYEARVIVHWQAIDVSGKYLSFVADQVWTLVERDGRLKIKRYVVRPAVETNVRP